MDMTTNTTRYQCRSCNKRFSPDEQRPVEVVRTAGGSYNRAGRTYYPTICEGCAIIAVEHDPGRAMSTYNDGRGAIGINSARRALEAIGVDTTPCGRKSTYRDLDRTDLQACTRLAGHDGDCAAVGWTLDTTP